MTMKIKTATMLTAAGLLAVGAQAGTITEVQEPADGEKSHEEIFEDIFGGDFSSDGDNGFTDGSIDLVRVDDNDDQVYNFISWSAEAHAVWAKAWQMFGTSDDGSLLNVEGEGDDASGSLSDVVGDGSVVFGRFGDEFLTSDVFTDPTLNGDGLDHVVTYRYVGTAGEGGEEQVKYFLFFEDLLDGAPRHDFDYNDLVVEIEGVVPEPTSLALMAIGGLCMLRRRR